MNTRVIERLHHFRAASQGGPADPSDTARIRVDPENSRVRRALFGPGDHDENIRFANQELARERREASERWNYDFENDCPKEGRYVWEQFDAGNSNKRVCDTPLHGNQRNKVVTTSSSQTSKSTLTTSAPGSCSAAETSGQRQTTMTAHFPHRKRSRSKTKVQERKADASPDRPSLQNPDFVPVVAIESVMANSPLSNETSNRS